LVYDYLREQRSPGIAVPANPGGVEHSRHTVHPRWQPRFERLLREVLDDLPPIVQGVLEKIPLHVEDYPSRQVMREMGVRYRDELCGLYTGVPLTERGLEQPEGLPDVVTIYREGILAAAADQQGRVSPKKLKEEIRKTILHELAHHHGLSEEELAELGYE
jgi:predicted Zn-dependent protease with MMP-like domain